VPVVEEAKDNKRSLAEDIVWNTGKLITNVLDNANPLYQYIQQEVPVVEEAKDNKRSLAEDIVWNTGKLITNVLDNANPLYQYIQKERLSVGLSKLQDNLMETESKWIPQI